MKKLVDTNQDVSRGGKADQYWRNKPLKPSSKYAQKGTLRDTEIDPIKIIEKYSLKGFEYGNWVNNNDRGDRLLATRTSLYHLSLIIGSQNLGLDSTLGIAFGARGSGGALAHFEPNAFMINLTKEKGFGSLAHEYGHALDYFFGMYVDQNRTYPAMSGGRSTAASIPENKGGGLRYLCDRVVDMLISYDNGERTDSYKQIASHTNNNNYWLRRNELFARFFEQWVQYKMQSKNIQNTFLTKKKYESKVYFLKKDFDKVLPLMDKLIFEMSQFMNNKKKYISEVNIKMAAATSSISNKKVKGKSK